MGITFYNFEYVYRALSLLRIDRFVRCCISSNRVTIVLYHNPKVDIFNQHVEYFSRHYKFLPFAKLISAIHNKDWSDIPKNGLVVSFDDGHMGNYSLLPIFKQYKIQPIIFLCTQVVGTNRRYWWVDIPKMEVEKLKKVGNRERLRELKTTYGFIQEMEFPNQSRVALSSEEIEEMMPYVHYGNHTQFHTIVTNLEEEEFPAELNASQSDLEEIIPYRLDHFAFPNGDYSEREIKYLKQNGFKSARTTRVGWNSMNSNPFALKIIGISDNATLPKLKFQLSGIFGFMLACKKWSN